MQPSPSLRYCMLCTLFENDEKCEPVLSRQSKVIITCFKLPFELQTRVIHCYIHCCLLYIVCSNHRLAQGVIFVQLDSLMKILANPL